MLRLELQRGVRFRRVADEGVVVDAQGPRVIVVNRTGIRVLELIRDAKTDDLAATLAAECGLQVDDVTEDVSLFVAELIDQGLAVEQLATAELESTDSAE